MTSATRERTILALLSEKSIRAAAKRSGIGERTLRRWLTDDEAFKTEYTAARQAVFQAGIYRVQMLTARAIETLEDLLAAKDHPNVRLGAARTVAELAIHQHEAETLASSDSQSASRRHRPPTLTTSSRYSRRDVPMLVLVWFRQGFHPKRHVPGSGL